MEKHCPVCGNLLTSPVAPPSQQILPPPHYAIVAEGEGAMAQTATEKNLRNALHGLMCVCGVEFWYHCKTEGVREAIETLDDETRWNLDEDKRKFSIRVLEHETGSVVVYALAALRTQGPK